jgi:hypothetical protein
VVYLGPDLPPEQIAEAARSTGAQVIVLALTGADGVGRATEVLRKTVDLVPSGVQLWVGGAKSKKLVDSIKKAGAFWIEDFDRLEYELARLGARF